MDFSSSVFIGIEPESLTGLIQHHINLGIGVYIHLTLLPSYSVICYLTPCTSTSAGAMSAPAVCLASNTVPSLKPALSGSLPN